MLYLTLTSWLDKRTENADRERLEQAEKDRRARRARPALSLCYKQRVPCLRVSAAVQSFLYGPALSFCTRPTVALQRTKPMLSDRCWICRKLSALGVTPKRKRVPESATRGGGKGFGG